MASQHIASFLKYVTPATRQNYLPVLCEMVSRTTPTNWRPREILSMQLPELIGLFTPESTNSVVAPLCFALLEDVVAVVRDRSIAAFGPLVDRFGDEHPEWRGAVLTRLQGLARSDTFVRRQLFLHVAVLLASSAMPRDLYMSEVMPYLLPLASDTVPNVRICLARSLLTMSAWLLEDNGMRGAIVELLQDTNRDVRDFVRKFRLAKPDVLEQIAGALGDLPPPAPLPVPQKEPSDLNLKLRASSSSLLDMSWDPATPKATFVDGGDLPPPPPSPAQETLAVGLAQAEAEAEMELGLEVDAVQPAVVALLRESENPMVEQAL
jgi:hypothetical protein